MAERPPAWFLGSLDELAQLGLPALDDYRRDDLWGGWEERWGTRRPADASTTLSRVLSLYPGGVWTCASLRATPRSSSFRDWFAALAAISRAALVIGDVEEMWSAGSTVRVRFAANGGGFELVPTLPYGSTLTRELLDAVNATVDGVVFHELVIGRGEDDEDDDDITIVCLPRQAARELRARGVRFVETAVPMPPSRGRAARWLEKLGVVERPPAATPPLTSIRRLGDRPTIATRATRPEAPLLSEIVADAGGLRRVTDALQPHARPTWSPVTEPGGSPAHASQFGGAPWLHADEHVPRCASCDTPMSLAVQLDLEALPAVLRATGLLQCFVCLDDHEAHARVVGRARRAAAQPAARLPARAIVGWAERGSELPGPAHWDSLGVRLGEPAASIAEDELEEPAEDDKLGGWPAYIQQPSLGRCSQCGQARELLIQVASEGNLAIHFGDGGRLFVATCRDHPEAVAARIEFH